jgi:hypothetical protein
MKMDQIIKRAVFNTFWNMYGYAAIIAVICECTGILFAFSIKYLAEFI